MFAFHGSRAFNLFSRDRFTWLILIASALAISIGSVPSAWAQYGAGAMPYMPRTNSRNNNNANNPRGAQPFSGSATISAIGSVGLEVTDSNGTNWALKPDKNCVTRVTGTADPSFLKPDLLVKFSSEFDKKGKASAPVSELEIISPQTTSAQRPETGGRKEGNETSAGPIIGHIKSIKNNLLTVQTIGGLYTVELAANPTIKVNVSDLRLAQVGDKVDATGAYNQQGLAVAKEITVTLSNPLGTPAKKKPADAKSAAGNSAAANK
ncbi:MAG TPA: hypothetical protein VFE46_17085 [Pirellulales bacterium]|jgi:hypothetical protein|nr:hypothetical protein [Pirellulales bacterium]